MNLKSILGAVLAFSFALSANAMTFTSEEVSRAIDRNLQQATAGGKYESSDIQGMRMMLLNQANQALQNQQQRQSQAKPARKSNYQKKNLLQSYKNRAKKFQAKKDAKKRKQQVLNSNVSPFSNNDYIQPVSVQVIDR